MQAEDRGFGAAFLAEFPDAPDVRRERTRAESGLARLVQRAKETGQLRKDFDTSDVTLPLLANDGVLQELRSSTRTNTASRIRPTTIGAQTSVRPQAATCPVRISPSMSS